MIGFEKTHFLWKDPAHNPKEVSNVLKDDLFKLLGVIILASTVFLIFLHSMYEISLFNPFIALIAIIFFIGVIYFLNVRFAPYIVVKDTHIYRGLNDETAEEWYYKNISHCRFSSEIINGNTFNTMEIETGDGEQIQLLIAHKIPVDALRLFLISKGINIL